MTAVTDVLTEEQRRFNMSRIRARDTGPELRLRRALFKAGVRGYRLKYNLQGKPDLVFVKRRVAVFVDGCFWHKCPVHFTLPETRTEFWENKIERNARRDAEVNRKLMGAGWLVLRFWEHEIDQDVSHVTEQILRCIRQEADLRSFRME